MVRELKIREADPSDWPAIVRFNTELAWETERKQLQPAIIEAGVKRLLADRHHGQYFLAEWNGEVVGQMMFTREWSDWRNGEIWWLQSIYVMPTHRRTGVFRELLSHLTATARSNPAVIGLRLYMEAHNEQARETYLRAGFSDAGYVVMEHIFRNQPNSGE